MDELYDFLRSRNVSEEIIQQLEKDKIDSSVFLLMTDEQLKAYLPSYGDRLAVLGFCRRRGKYSVGRKSKLFDRLRAKISKNKTGEYEHVSKKENSKNAEKTVRKVELGWLNFRNGKFFQVRTKKGGGTRKIDVSKNCRKNELIKKASELFFPNQKNAEGKITDFEVDLTDFQERSLDEHITVGELYEQTKLPLLRFYLTTKSKDNIRDSQPEKHSGTIASTDTSTTHQFPHTSQSTLPTEPEAANTTDVIYVGTSSDWTNTNADIFSFVYSTVNMDDLSSVTELDVANNLESGTVTFLTEHMSETDTLSLDDTLLLSSPSSSSGPSIPLLDVLQEPPVQSQKRKKILVLHRGQILKELISHFCDESVTQNDVSIQVILPELGTQHLSLFLRFCTGSDLFLGKSISVSFTQMQGFQRRPVAHTCGCYLELPVNYENYPDFRHEMNRVLESSVWVMDIV